MRIDEDTQVNVTEETTRTQRIPSRRRTITRARPKTKTVRKTEWTKARTRDLLKDLKGRTRTGDSVKTIAKRFGVSPGAIYQKAFEQRVTVYGKPS